MNAKSIGAAALAIAATLGAGVGAAEPPAATSGQAEREAYIPFANHGGIRDWQVVDESSVLIQDQRGQWFLAKVMGPAFTLPHSENMGVVTAPSGTLERFSEIVVQGKRYPIVSLTRAAAPTPPRQ